MVKSFRTQADRLLQGLVKLCMLTGVTFLVTACYGPMPDRSQEEEAEIAEIEQVLEDSLNNHETGRD